MRAQLIKPWQNTVVVKLLGRPIGYKFLCNRLESLWTITKGFKVIDLENGFFLDRFRLEDDVDCASTQGPWIVLGHYFIIQQWTPYLDSTSEKIDWMVAWIRLPSMPLHYYKKKKVFRMVGQLVGKVIHIYYNMELAYRGKFTRIVVETALDKPLRS